MKLNLKFFTTVSALLLSSSLILTGCMFAVGESDVPTQPYDMGSRLAEIPQAVIDETPTAQTELDKKFRSMSEINDESKTITVITEDYLKDYWQSNYEKKMLRSLTTEEVIYIIQDSLRLYKQYNTIILPGFEAQTDDAEIAARFPELTPLVILRDGDIEYLSYNSDRMCVYDIIIYRLRALSSPEAFVSADDSALYDSQDRESHIFNYPKGIFYLPGLGEETDIELAIRYIEGDAEARAALAPFSYFNVIRSSRFNESRSGWQNIDLYSGEDFETVYPVAGLEMMRFDIYTYLVEIAERSFHSEAGLYLYPYDASFSFWCAYPEEQTIEGKFKVDGDKIILYPDTGAEEGKYYYIFQYENPDQYTFELKYLADQSAPLGDDIFPMHPDFGSMERTSTTASDDNIQCDFSFLSTAENEALTAMFHAEMPEDYTTPHNSECSRRLHLRTKDLRISFCTCNIMNCNKVYGEWYSGGCIAVMMNSKKLTEDEIALIDSITSQKLKP